MIPEKPETIGIIPAAGKANRLGRLPFSKELYPIAYNKFKSTEPPKTVSQYLLENMSLAGIRKFHFIIRDGKWDIPSYFGSGSQFKNNICYHLADYEYGVPFTVNQAFPFVKDKIVLLGFPDVLFKPANAFKSILNKLNKEQSTSVMLGLFPTQKTEKYDMVSFDENQNITDIRIKKSKQTHLKYAWVIAAWKPDFTAFLNDFVINKLRGESEKKLLMSEYYMGDVMRSAIKSGIKIKGVTYNKGQFLDIGTPDDLNRMHQFKND